MEDDIEEEIKKKMEKLIENEYYAKVLDAWFKAYKRAGNKPERIMKKYLLEDGGLINHQRFDHYFPNVEDIYKITRFRFRSRMKNVMYCYHHQNALGTDIWEQYLVEVLKCWKESRIAIRRNDITFFGTSLLELKAYLEQDLFEVNAGDVAYRRCFAALLGLILSIAKEWDKENYNPDLIEKYARQIARLSYSLNHYSSGFSMLIGDAK